MTKAVKIEPKLSKYTCNWNLDNGKECGKTYANEGNLKRHMKIHKEDPMGHCKFCQKPFWVLSDMKKHEINVHMKKEIVQDCLKPLEQMKNGSQLEVPELKNHMKQMPGILMNYLTVLQKTIFHRSLQNSKHSIYQRKILKQSYY